MNFDVWLKKNEALIDWNLFSLPWDMMQLKYNPFRQEQIEAILHSSGVLDLESPVVLDLGCGPGILGKRIAIERPMLQYSGVDVDPLMLSAMQHLLVGIQIRALQIDLRKTEWSHGFRGHFDSVVSLTALHWLSQEHQKQTYKAAYDVLKPGGTFIVGDPYQPEDAEQRKLLETLHNELASKQTGLTWEEFWKGFFEAYPIKEMYTEYHKQQGYQIPFEGSDDGYFLSTHLKALREAGFNTVAVFWKEDLRAVYGGTK